MVEVLSVNGDDIPSRGVAIMRGVSVWLLCVDLLIVMGWLVPPARDCWIPPGASTRAFYDECWTFDEAGYR